MRIRGFIGSAIILCVAATVAQSDTIIDNGNVAREGSIKGIDERGVVLLWSLTGGEKAFAFDDIKTIKSDTINELAWAEEELAHGRSAAAIRQYQKAMRKAGRTWLSEYAAARIVQAQAQEGRAVEAIKGFLQLAESGSHLAAQMGALPISDCGSKDWDDALALIDKSIAAGAAGAGGEGKLAHVKWLKQVKAAVVEARGQANDSAESTGTGEGAGGTGSIAERPSSDEPASDEPTGEPSSEPEVAAKEYFPVVEGRLSPVSPDEPVSDEVRQIFKEFYAEKVAKVLQSPDYADDVALAIELVEAAEKRMEFPAFAAYALDHAVYLASISNDGQLLSYEALRTQLAHKLRSPAGCLELMLSIAPRVMTSQDAAKCGMWIQDRLSGDVLAWFDVQRQTGEYAKALSMSARLQTACEKRLGGQVPEALRESLKTIELISGYHISLQHCVAKVGQEEGEFPREHLFYGIHLLTIEKKSGPAATCLMKSEDEAGVRLGECLRKAGGSGSDDYAVACAIAALAEKYEHEIAQALLWREALAWLEKAVSSGGLDKIDALRADMLKERYEAQVAATGDKIPPSFAGGTTAASDDNSFFGLSNSGGKSTGGGSHSFFGITSKGPQSVVYVIDRSGSMTDSFQFVKQELIRSIKELTEKDQFHVIFYSSGPGLEMPARKLVPAHNTNKQVAIKFIEETGPLGQTDPSDALDKAFRQKPRTVFLLTDGEFDASIPAYISRLNRNKQTSVNTVCFMYTMGEAACKKIAEENKGVYKFVGIDEMRSKTEESRTVATRPGATRTPSATPATPATPPPPPGPPLPKTELERLERMIMVLEERQVCQACKGHPVKEVREVVPGTLWSSRRIIYRKVICPTCNGTGHTPASVMSQTIREVKDMLNKYGSSVPADVRHRAEKAMSTYK